MTSKRSYAVSHDTLNAYLKAIGKIPVTAREEEVDLASRIQQGDSEATKRLVE
ncbi:MAG: sigma-70 factor domain-containing protein, partial [Candidatus Vecturithrix sp.]|nr:sigma-70 factor domain-containing protein [Candidatus Vecturithrix sp.]